MRKEIFFPIASSSSSSPSAAAAVRKEKDTDLLTTSIEEMLAIKNTYVGFRFRRSLILLSMIEGMMCTIFLLWQISSRDRQLCDLSRSRDSLDRGIRAKAKAQLAEKEGQALESRMQAQMAEQRADAFKSHVQELEARISQLEEDAELAKKVNNSSST